MGRLASVQAIVAGTAVWLSRAKTANFGRAEYINKQEAPDTTDHDVPSKGPHQGPRESTPPSPLPPALREKLVASCRALSGRQLDAARMELDEAEHLAKQPEHKKRVKRLRRLHHYVAQFWGAVKDALKDLDATDEIEIDDDPVAIVVEISKKQICLWRDGQQLACRIVPGKDYTIIKDMPWDLVMAIADCWFDQSKPQNSVFKGAFLAVDPGANSKDARRLWNEAEAAGINTHKLMEVLEEYEAYTED